jgi:hypothetical protein
MLNPVILIYYQLIIDLHIQSKLYEYLNFYTHARIIENKILRDVLRIDFIGIISITLYSSPENIRQKSKNLIIRILFLPF